MMHSNFLTISEDNLYGMVCRSARVVEATEKLLGEEVYHYHSKIMLKERT